MFPRAEGCQCPGRPVAGSIRETLERIACFFQSPRPLVDPNYALVGFFELGIFLE